jgi:GNAT superfamily N-acetyltransferase
VELDIKVCTEADRSEFMQLWLTFLRENYAAGGEILPTEKNLFVFTTLFQIYVTQARPGVALMATLDKVPCAVLMWGDPGPGLETRWGRLAMGWGTWVHPEVRRHGIADALRAAGKAATRAMGFDAVVGTSLASNAAGLESGRRVPGMKLHSYSGVIDLHEGE